MRIRTLAASALVAGGALLFFAACRTIDRTPSGPNLALSVGCDDATALNFGSDEECQYPLPCPAGSFTYTLLPSGDLYITYDQFPAPNDNSYGVNAVAWQRDHKFGDLVGSDHAGFQLVDPSGVVRLSFNVDYLTATKDPDVPSGYASLGVTGGDGKMLVGTSDGITATTSLANNLNNINIPGLFDASHVQQFGSVNVLMDSPPTDPAHQTYAVSDPSLAGWDFHNTYYVTISAAKLASLGFDQNTWDVEPNDAQLHNSPAKVCPTEPGSVSLSVTKVEVKDRHVRVTITNDGSTDAFLSGLEINWPFAVNGTVTKVKRDGDVVYDNPDLGGGSALLTLADLVSDQNKRKWDHNHSHVLDFEFAQNADPDLGHYSGTVTFGDDVLTILPPPDPGPPSLTITRVEVKDRHVRVTISNDGPTDVFLTGLALTWPDGVNGVLKKVKRDGDVLYDNPDLGGGSAVLALADLVSDQNKRKWDHNHSHVLDFEFAQNADPDLAHYAATVSFGDFNLIILPQ